MKRFLIIEGIDFSQPVYGSGGATVINSALRNVHQEVYLVGATSSRDHKIGEWTSVEYYKKAFNFLPVIHMEKLVNPIVKSQNLQFALSVFNNMNMIKTVKIKSIFTQTYTVLWVILLFPNKWDICFYYPGLGNPFVVGRRPQLGKWLAPLYQLIQGLIVRKTSICFAAACEESIREYNQYLRKIGTRVTVKSLPTGVNTDLFTPIPTKEAREKISLPNEYKIFVFIGRLAEVKGLPLLIAAIGELIKQGQRVILLLVGDGEEKNKLKNMVTSLRLENNIKFCGLVDSDSVALHISAADVCVVSSYVEGFSNAMIEQISCGKPIVSTAVSGAKDIIIEGKNGFILENRDPVEFARKMIEATKLSEAEDISRDIAVKNYSEKKLWGTVIKEWASIRKNNF
jgi:glycosyltransferase involved in cell wall biosynthesis